MFQFQRLFFSAIEMVGGDVLPVNHPDRRIGRSNRWPTVRKHFLEKNPVCCVSGLKTDLDVHHVKPFHLHPELELDESNLRTISRPYHFLFGHLTNWHTYNPDFDKMVEEFRAKIAESKRNY